ncbi:hypothetical protein F5887DRAFT_1083145 [Amanita rubescens]|nr:hypothetical protein F5887DRAFT_1086449 [Amanita rubescens]KAF8328480.1 hypothetical protein F5887DRAFT_1083145 [Amanita rubescens]
MSAFSAVWERTRLFSQPNYLACPEFDSTVAWKSNGSSHVLVSVQQVSAAISTPNDVREDAVMVVVGEALPNRLNISPRGNFNPQYTTDVTASKFQLLLGSPADADLA